MKNRRIIAALMALFLMLGFIPHITYAEGEPDYYLFDVETSRVLTKLIKENTGTSDVEYMLQTNLETGQKIKVVAIQNGTITAWYPNGFGNEYVVPEEFGNSEYGVTLFFRPYVYDEWLPYGFSGYCYIGKNYPINITITNASEGYGTITSNYDVASRHTKIILTITPENEYRWLDHDSFSVVDSDGQPVSYSFSEDGTQCTFIILEKGINVTATFATEVYSINFYQEDPALMGEDNYILVESFYYPWGAMPNDPWQLVVEPEPTEQYTYTFAGWSPEITTVTNAADYYAVFEKTTRKYNVNFVNYDGTVLQSTLMPYGETPIYNGDTPTKPKDDQYTYEFLAWTPSVVSVTTDATYTATYSSTVNEYTIKFVNYDGTELQSTLVPYGETPIYNGDTPTKPKDDQYTYTFDGWDKDIVKVTGEATYTATYSSTVNKYTIKFVDEDGTELQSSEVEYGTLPSYTGDTPVKQADAQYTYTFDGWDKDIVEVTGEATYTATYSSTVNKYVIKFVDEDGTVLQSEEVEYGETPVFNGETPVKDEDEVYTYSFAGWDKDIVEVTGEATYTATYTAEEKPFEYTVYEGADGSYTKGSGESYAAVIKRSINDASCFGHYLKTLIDGEEVEVESEAGSTKITISPAVLDSLSVREHTVKVVFDDGEAEFSITVSEGPSTGDTASIALYLILMAMSATGSAAVFLTKRKDG